MSDLEEKLKECSSSHDIANIKSQYLGKSGIITNKFGSLKDAALDERKELGRSLNILKTQIQNLIAAKLIEIQDVKNDNKVDITLPGKNISTGSKHPVSITINGITSILAKYGFTSVSGVEVEDEFHNFEALNIPETHPARDMHDTFYVSDDKLLRTHTSSVQIRSMLSNKAPLKIMTPGKVYRCDSDPTHSPMFHQIEGLYIDKNVNFCHLKGVLISFITEFFGKDMEIRFRPSYFPFTEPSAELDIKFKGKWLEVLGCGMVHPNVLSNVKIDTKKYSGFAFGLGIERLAMLKYDIVDLRMFYENDISFLSQFKGLK
ncbi:MAG: phenylalanine--tRNA ligase subunit alpha [Gammaproteobacteria bacterium]|nr:phenylalanine--tRNA ligase subunit alpha [Gammaproteobacteria bacterium]MBT5406319.1 phenylalanine--tRNA ligase subunit alpha [Gammaproteobacteria bacterium]MBT5863842.1 phenylalanine--tRNA ligase subunit alpha [Gammaproteobacteria bacterium]MBT6734702.1 phenylalanine--tRNA ligase subunit alpha [Gammaproteobacteria bacterium]MBT7237209.1 phenylalanine--tRNA ligase subunit alpha [Gammaproteobacteria bacterium]